jgi:hypothetical protein
MAANAGYLQAVKVATSDTGYATLELCTDAPLALARDMADTTAYGSMGRTRTATLLKFSGSFDFCYDNGATNQGLVRTALSAGSDLWIEILPDGTHGAKCCCKIESIDYKAPVDGVVKCSAKFVENGAWATV